MAPRALLYRAPRSHQQALLLGPLAPYHRGQGVPIEDTLAHWGPGP